MEANASPPIMPYLPATGFCVVVVHRAKEGKGKEVLSKKGSSDSAQTGFGVRCACRQNPYPARSSPAIGCQATTNSAGIVLSDRSFAERLFGFSTPGLLMKRGSAKIRLG